MSAIRYRCPSCKGEWREGEPGAHCQACGAELVARKFGRPRVHATAAAKQAAYRDARGVPVSVILDDETKAALDAFMARNARDGGGLTLSEVIGRLLRSQLLRKR